MAFRYYYADASISGPTEVYGTVWSNMANAVDGSLATFASASATSANIRASGTTAPSSDSASIQHVYVRGYGRNTEVWVYEDSSGSIGSNIGVTVDRTDDAPTAWVLLDPPTGGWTWDALSKLWVEFVPRNGPEIRAIKAEFLVHVDDVKVASWTSNNTAGATQTSLTLTAPSGISSGDLLVAFGASDTDGATGSNLSTSETGWTKIAEAGDGDADCAVAAWYKVATGSEGSFTFDCTDSDELIGWYLRITGADSNNPINDFGIYLRSVGSPYYLHTGSVVATTENDCLCLSLVATDGSDCVSNLTAGPTDWAEFDTSAYEAGGNDVGGYLGYYYATFAGPLPSGSFTSSTDDGAATVCIAIQAPPTRTGTGNQILGGVNVVEQLQTYWDGSATDQFSVWTDDANGCDGSTSTYTYTTSTGSQTFNDLDLDNRNYTNPGYSDISNPISKIEIRLLYSGSGTSAAGSFRVYYSVIAGTPLSTKSFSTAATGTTPTWTSWFEFSSLYTYYWDDLSDSTLKAGVWKSSGTDELRVHALEYRVTFVGPSGVESTLTGTFTAGGGASATIAQSLSAPTQAASGYYANNASGTATQTLGAVTQSASGLFVAGITGTAAQTLGSLSQAATGTHTTDFIIQSLQSVTQAATGTFLPLITGTGASGLASGDTISAYPKTTIPDDVPVRELGGTNIPNIWDGDDNTYGTIGNVFLTNRTTFEDQTTPRPAIRSVEVQVKYYCAPPALGGTADTHFHVFTEGMVEELHRERLITDSTIRTTDWILLPEPVAGWSWPTIEKLITRFIKTAALSTQVLGDSRIYYVKYRINEAQRKGPISKAKGQNPKNDRNALVRQAVLDSSRFKQAQFFEFPLTTTDFTVGDNAAVERPSLMVDDLGEYEPNNFEQGCHIRSNDNLGSETTQYVELSGVRFLTPLSDVPSTVYFKIYIHGYNVAFVTYPDAEFKATVRIYSGTETLTTVVIPRNILETVTNNQFVDAALWYEIPAPVGGWTIQKVEDLRLRFWLNEDLYGDDVLAFIYGTELLFREPRKLVSTMSGQFNQSGIFTGSISQSLSAVAQSASGTFDNPNAAGTIAQSLGAITQSATGTYAPKDVTSTVAQTLSAITQTATGTYTPKAVTSTIAQTLGTVTQAATGTFASWTGTATITQTLQPVAQSATGTYAPKDVTSTITQSLQPVAQTATGTYAPKDVTATISQTLSFITQSATGTYTPKDVTSTIAQTLSAITQIATGTYVPKAVSGTITQLLPMVMQSAAGTHSPPVFSADIAQTFFIVTQSLSGTNSAPSFDATISQTFQPISQALSGTYAPKDVTSTVAQTLQPITQSATGTYAPKDVTSTIAQALQPVTQAATGLNLFFSASIAQTLQPITQSATGTYSPKDVTSTIAQALQPVTQAATGTYTPKDVTSTITQTLQPVTQAATGTYAPKDVTSTIAQTLQPVTQSATGSFSAWIGSATIAQSLQPVAQSATGTYTPKAVTSTITQSLQPVSQFATGTYTPKDVTSTIAQTLQPVTQAATGSFSAWIGSATIAQTLQPITQSATGTYAPKDVTSTIAQMLWPITQDVTGTFTAWSGAGTITQALQPVAQSATGTFAAWIGTATVGQALQPITQILTGTYAPKDVTATIAQALQPVTQSATGTYTPKDVTSIIAQALQPITQAATGSFSTWIGTATITQSLQPVTQSLTGTFSAWAGTGAIAQSLQSITQSLTGTYDPKDVTATIAQTLWPITQALTGTYTPKRATATIAQTLWPITQVVTGTFGPGASLGPIVQTLQPISQAASGTYLPKDVTGTIAQTLQPVTQVVIGTYTPIPRTGTIAQTLPFLTQHLIAFQIEYAPIAAEQVIWVRPDGRGHIWVAEPTFKTIEGDDEVKRVAAKDRGIWIQ